MAGLRLQEMADREVLFVLSDVADDNGVGTTEEIMERLNLSSEHPKLSVASRFSWLRRYGAVERALCQRVEGEKEKIVQGWKLTEIGGSMLNGKLAKPVADGLEGLTQSQMLTVTRVVTQLYRTTDPTAAHLVRREWIYGTHPSRFA